jgi:hypothetical protein
MGCLSIAANTRRLLNPARRMSVANWIKFVRYGSSSCTPADARFVVSLPAGWPRCHIKIRMPSMPAARIAASCSCARLRTPRPLIDLQQSVRTAQVAVRRDCRMRIRDADLRQRDRRRTRGRAREDASARIRRANHRAATAASSSGTGPLSVLHNRLYVEAARVSDMPDVRPERRRERQTKSLRTRGPQGLGDGDPQFRAALTGSRRRRSCGLVGRRGRRR